MYILSLPQEHKVYTNSSNGMETHIIDVGKMSTYFHFKERLELLGHKEKVQKKKKKHTKHFPPSEMVCFAMVILFLTVIGNMVQQFEQVCLLYPTNKQA